MSTEINVVVDAGGLRERNRQQTQANRQAKQEGDQRKDAAETAQQAANRANSVTSPSGLKSGTLGRGSISVTSNSYRDSRMADEPTAQIFRQSMLLLPQLPDAANEWFDPFTQAVLKISAKGRYPRTCISGTANTTSVGRPTYYADGGPSDAPMLAAVPVANPQPGTPNRSENFVGLTAVAPTERKLREFTLQMYFRFGTSLVQSQPWPEVGLELGPINMFFTLKATSPLHKELYYSVRPEGQSTATVYQSGSVTISDITTPPLLPGVWHHVAMTLQGGVAHAFFDGKRWASVTLAAPAIERSLNTSGSWFNLAFGQSVTGFVNPAQPVYVHGVKFEEKCRWTTDFTPPARL